MGSKCSNTSFKVKKFPFFFFVFPPPPPSKKHKGAGGRLKKPDYENVPTACFVQPPLAACGLTEEEVTARVESSSSEGDGGEKASSSSSQSYDIFVSKFRPMRNTLSGRNEATLMKMIVDSATDEVVGCHMVRG